MKRFLIQTYTNWCGEELDYSAIAESDLDPELCTIAENAAYESFISFSGMPAILEELFPEVIDEEYTDEQIEKATEVEGDYYGFSIEEWDETRDEEEWNWYELIYDANEAI